MNIQELIKSRGQIGKYEGVAPEGFVLVHEKSLDLLQDMPIWIEWRMGRITIEELNNYNLEKELQ